MTNDEWEKRGWIKCKYSGIYYHPIHSVNGCGNCTKCISGNFDKITSDKIKKGEKK